MTISRITKATAALLAPVALAGATLAPIAAASAANTPAHAAVSGDGSNDNPYTQDCTYLEGTNGCVVAFPGRALKGLQSESVPAYKCPSGYRWLLNRTYAPYGTALPQGVEVERTNPVGVSITHASGDPHGDIVVLTGTKTGFWNSSVTNWSFESGTYRIILHCTDDFTNAANDPAPPNR